MHQSGNENGLLRNTGPGGVGFCVVAVVQQSARERADPLDAACLPGRHSANPEFDALA
jgi:hypothetical protein